MVGDAVERLKLLGGVDAWAGGVLEGEVVSVTPPLPRARFAADVESVTCRVKV